MRLAQICIVGIAGIAVSVFAFRMTRSADRDQVSALLELRADSQAHDMESQLAAIGRSAESLTVFIAAEDELTAAEFRLFAQLVHERTVFDSGLYWSPWVSGPGRASFVAKVRRDSDPDYDIREIGTNGRSVPAAPRAEYLPRQYEETFDRGPGIRGFDLLSKPDRRALVDRVRDSGTAFALVPGPGTLGPGGARTDSILDSGFIVLWPVYSVDVVPRSVEARRAGFRGIAAARFRLDRLLPGLIAGTPDIIESIDIAVGSDYVASKAVASYDPAKKQLTVGDTPAPDDPGSVTLVRGFTVFGQQWTLRSHFGPEPMSRLTSSKPWVWLILGLVTTAILMVYVWRATARVQEVEVIVTETDERFRRMFDENPIGMSINTAFDYRFVQVNRALCRMLGYSEQEMIGRHRDDFAAPDSINMPPALPHASDAGWHPVDKHYITKSGTVVTARVRVMRLPPATDGEALVVGLAEDVTEQRKLEAGMRQAQKMDAIGQLTGGIAHDFNNLLGIIVGNLDILRGVLAEHDEAGGLVGEALAAAWRGADLTRRLLAFARRQPLNPDRIALNERIVETTKLLTRTLGERVRISLDLAPDIWSVMVDPVQLEACIINLAANARDAMPNGGTLTIATSNRRLDALFVALHPDVIEGDYVLIEVSDTGFGMTEEVLAQIFEPFFTTKGRGKGTGLGLSMVFGFLKQSNGHIHAHSQPDVGSTFRLYLPRMGSAGDDRPAKDSRQILRGSGETVLVVEDNEPLRRVVVRQLHDLGYTVIESDGAGTALAILARQPIALVFTDIVMPGQMDGFGLANAVLSQWPATRVLLTSGFPETKINGKLGTSGLSARLLTKPYRTDGLARAVREVLDA